MLVDSVKLSCSYFLSLVYSFLIIVLCVTLILSKSTNFKTINDKNRKQTLFDFRLIKQPSLSLVFVETEFDSEDFVLAAELNNDLKWKQKPGQTEIKYENSTFLLKRQHSKCKMTVSVNILIELNVPGQYGFYVEVNDIKVAACSYYFDIHDDELSSKCHIEGNGKNMSFYSDEYYEKKFYSLYTMYHEIMLDKVIKQPSKDPVKVNLWFESAYNICYIAIFWCFTSVPDATHTITNTLCVLLENRFDISNCNS